MSKKTSKDNNINYDGCYGEICNASEIVDFIMRSVEDNFTRKKPTERWSLNIWGHAGVGKTSLVKSLENRPVEFKGKKYDGFQIKDVPLAQIEEMGDVLGCPEDYVLLYKEDISNKETKRIDQWVMAKDSIVNSMINDGWKYDMTVTPVTKYAPPDWVPKEARPGFIVFDDGNRAGIRILKGLMQLVQNYRTIGWEIPDGWTIVFTGNPDRQQYLVQTVDQAIITRQRHITMKPDVKEWSVWATQNDVDKRGISFLLRYPEMIIGDRTNLRTLTEFFYAVKKYGDINEAAVKRKVTIDGSSLIDQTTLATFFTFCNRDMKDVIDPEDILEGKDSVYKHVDKLLSNPKEPRIDILAITCDRLFAYLTREDCKGTQKEIDNFQTFASYEKLPEDMRNALLKRTVSYQDKTLKKFVIGNRKLLSIVAEVMNFDY